jgi:Zn-dependent peptidase ImmA (M78 family)
MSTRDDLLNAARRANEVLEEFEVRKRIEQGYTRIDPVRVAESADVPVMFQPLQKLLGAYLNEGRPGIMVNINRGPGLIHMTCAHELGHYFLDHRPQTDLLIEYGDNANIVERQADQFAFSLLLPRWLLKVIMTRKGWKSFTDPVVLYQLSLRLGTSYTSTVWTLQRMKVISPAVANELARVQPKNIKALLTGGEAPDDKGDVWLVDQHDRDYILEPQKSDYFVFDLPSKAGAGYVWSLEDVVAKGYAVEPLQNDVRVTPVEKHFGPNPEFGPNHSRRFVATPAGDDEQAHEDPESFSMYQRRPWEKRPPEGLDNQCTFNTEFELISNGLDPKERMRRVEEVKATA